MNPSALPGVIQRFLETIEEYAVTILDTSGHILTWNAGAKAIIGYEADEAIGQHFSIFYPPESRVAGHPERELLAAATMGRYQEEGWRIRKDGSQFWAHIVLAAITDDEGTVIAFGKVTRDITKRKQTEEQLHNVLALLEKTSHTDYLTGLGNRRCLDAMIAANISSAGRHDRPLSVAMIDLDHFKSFNDERGHSSGDRYLKKASACWRKALRKEDFLARYGGEEFFAILPDADLAQATVGMHRVHIATPGPLTCSIGIAQWDGAETGDSLISRADRALYIAKSGGRNQVAVLPAGKSVVQAFTPRQPKSTNCK